MKKQNIIIKDHPNADYNSNKKLLDALDNIVEKRKKEHDKKHKK